MFKFLLAVQVFSNKLLSHTHFTILEHNLLKIIFNFYFYISKRLYNSVSGSPWLPHLLNTPSLSQPPSSLLTIFSNISNLQQKMAQINLDQWPSPPIATGLITLLAKHGNALASSNYYKNIFGAEVYHGYYGFGPRACNRYTMVIGGGANSFKFMIQESPHLEG